MGSRRSATRQRIRRLLLLALIGLASLVNPAILFEHDSAQDSVHHPLENAHGIDPLSDSMPLLGMRADQVDLKHSFESHAFY